MTMFPKNPNRFSPANDLPAPTLRERIDDGSLTEDMKIKIVRQLVSAVGKLHEADIIHRDLKPGNILVDDLGNIQIIDFGLSADAGHQPNAFGGLVRSDSGTPPYMSPGQMRGEPALSPQDVFALGRTFNDLFRPRVRPGDKIPEGAFQRVKPQENFSPHIIDWWAADENLSNKALAVVLQEYRSSSIDDYQLGIKKATTLSEKEFLLWYGKRLSDLGAERYQDVRSGTFLKKPYAANVEGARLILGSKFLVNQFQKGMGLTATEQKALQAGIEVLRERYRGYYDRKGNRVEKAVSVFDEVPYYYFREFDRVNGSWWGRMFR